MKARFTFAICILITMFLLIHCAVEHTIEKDYNNYDLKVHIYNNTNEEIDTGSKIYLCAVDGVVYTAVDSITVTQIIPANNNNTGTNDFFIAVPKNESKNTINLWSIDLEHIKAISNNGAFLIRSEENNIESIGTTFTIDAASSNTPFQLVLNLSSTEIGFNSIDTHINSDSTFLINDSPILFRTSKNDR